jgi:hypothetical protein
MLVRADGVGGGGGRGGKGVVGVKVSKTALL